MEKRKLIYFLVLIVVVLLLLNSLLSVKKTANVEVNQDQIPKSEIKKKFLKVLDNFGFDNEWIKEYKLRSKVSDSVSSKYIVYVPKDIAIPIIIKDLNEFFSNLPVELSSLEKQRNGRTVLDFKSGNILKLKVELKYKTDLERKRSRIAFLVDLKNVPEIEKLVPVLKFGNKAGFILPLESDSEQIAEEIKKNNTDYFIKIYEGSDNVEFELDSDFDLKKLNTNIKNIISSFNSPKIFFIDPGNSNFTKEIIKYISEQFESRGRTIVMLNKYPNLTGENSEDLKSLLEFHLANINTGESKIFRINVESWEIIQDELRDYLKKGNLIVRPTSILNN